MGLLDKAAEKKSVPDKKVKAQPKAEKAPKQRRQRRSRRKESAEVVERPPARSRRTRAPREARAPRVMPSEFELAGRLNRFASGLVNFIVNWGLVVGGVVSNTMLDANATWILIGGGALAILNLILLPIFAGRNLGQFVSRTKNITSASKRPSFIHALLNNLTFPLFLLGGALVLISKFNNYPLLGGGIVMFSILPLDFFLFKRYLFQEHKQGIWDAVFGVYLVKHIPSGDETGWLAKLEGLGDFAEQKFNISERSASDDPEDSS